MVLVAALGGTALVSLGGSILKGALGFGPAFRIELGEYLQLRPAVAIPLAMAVVVLPFAVALPWSLRRLSAADAGPSRSPASARSADAGATSP